MTQEIRDRIAALAEKLGDTVFYNMEIHSSECSGGSYCQIVETHRLYASGYETIRRPTLNQIMSVIPRDFVPEKQEENK